MKNTKVFGIKEKDFFQFIKKINEFYSKNKVFATQTHYQKEISVTGDYEWTWFAIIYFESEVKNG